MNDQRVQGAIVGFNAGLGLYFFARYLPIFFAGKNVGWDWFGTQLMIGLVVGAVVAAIGYVVIGAMNK